MKKKKSGKKKLSETEGEFLDIHKRGVRLKSAKNMLSKSGICQHNKDLIRKYVDDRILEDNIAILTQEKNINLLRNIAEILGKPFDEATTKDIKRVMGEIYKRDVSEATKYDYGQRLRRFFKWLRKTDSPEETAWIKRKKPKPKRLLPEDQITWDDAVRLSNASLNLRDRALVQVLWDSGCRPEELLTLQLQDVEQESNGRSIILHFRKSKTEAGLRDPVIIRSAPALINWMEAHPLKGNKKAPLFCKKNKQHKGMDYCTLRKVLSDLAERCNFEKKVQCKMFRKSEASFRSQYLSDAENKQRHGWVQDSKMLSVYVHPDQRKTNERMKEIEGVKTPRETSERGEIKCPWCNMVNSSEQEFCSLCKRRLDSEQALVAKVGDKIDSKIASFIEHNPEIMERFTEFMKGVLDQSQMRG